VRREVNSALREMWQKTRKCGPAIGLIAASGALGLFAAASSYRLSLRLLEKRMSPAAAAGTATAAYGAAAACAGVFGVRMLRQMPLPLPTDTARETKEAVAEANREFSPVGSAHDGPASAGPASGQQAAARSAETAASLPGKAAKTLGT
jgi:hypothetical protein